MVKLEEFKSITCYACAGMGLKVKTKGKRCSKCKGAGHLQIETFASLIGLATSMTKTCLEQISLAVKEEIKEEALPEIQEEPKPLL